VSKAVLDASAILAILFKEPGGDVARGHLADSMVSAVNLSEVACKAGEAGMPLEEVSRLMAALSCMVVPFDGEQAYVAASLRVATRSRGLSLADRACLALGLHASTTVVTADRKWLGLKLGVEVIGIRA
jgi:PIN domain nuclease of toxin-antitoxin system